MKALILVQKAFYFFAKVCVFNFTLNKEITAFYYSLLEVFVETEYVKRKRNATAVLPRFVYLK